MRRQIGSAPRVLTSRLFQCEWLPASRSVAPQDQALMFVLHGRGDSLRAFRSVNVDFGLPYMNYVLLNAPDSFMGGRSWGTMTRDGVVRDQLRMRARLQNLLLALEDAGWDSKRIYWMGHSQGCFVATDIVGRHATPFAGIVGVSGYVAFLAGWQKDLARSGARATPWLFTHGDRDTIIPYKNIVRDVAKLRDSGLAVTLKKFAKGHDFEYVSEVPFIRKWLMAKRRTASSES